MRSTAATERGGWLRRRERSSNPNRGGGAVGGFDNWRRRGLAAAMVACVDRAARALERLAAPGLLADPRAPCALAVELEPRGVERYVGVAPLRVGELDGAGGREPLQGSWTNGGGLLRCP